MRPAKESVCSVTVCDSHVNMKLSALKPWLVRPANVSDCTAIIVGAMMILSVCLPHSGYDEDDYFGTLEAVRSIMDEGKKLGAVDFSSVVASTLNSSLSQATKIFRDSMALVGMGSVGRNVSEVAMTWSHVKRSCGGNNY